MELVVDGEVVYVHTGGRPFDAECRTLVLLHGAGFDHTAWRHQGRYLAHRGWSVAAPDLPGHARSGGTPLRSVEHLAAWLSRFLDALGSTEVVLSGHSMGALVALEVGDTDSRIRGRSLLSAAAEIRVHPDLLAGAEEGSDAVLALLRAWEHASHPGGNPVPGNWMMGEGWRLREGVGLDVLHADLLVCNTYGGGANAAQAIRTPTQLIGGASDRMVSPRASAELAGLLSDVESVSFAGAGHAVFLEQPREVARALDRFASRLLPA